MTMSRSGALDKLLDLFVQMVGVLADAASAVADFIAGIDGDILGNVVTGITAVVMAIKGMDSGLQFLQGFNPLKGFAKLFKKSADDSTKTACQNPELPE